MRIALLSDIHANSIALQAICDQMEKQTVNCIWFLGDLVGYNAGVVTCMRILQDLKPTVWLQGNHDMAICMLAPLDGPHKIVKAPDRRAWSIRHDNARPEAKHFDLLVPVQDTQEILAWHAQQLVTGITADELQSFREAPTWRLQSKEGAIVAHGAVRSPDPYSYKNVGANAYLHSGEKYLAVNSFKQAGSDARLLIVGHTHEQMLLQETRTDWESRPPDHKQARTSELTVSLESDRRYVINPGSVGQPRDGDPRAAYAILDTIQQTITFYRVAYAIEQMQAMMEPFYPEFYRRRLIEGK